MFLYIKSVCHLTGGTPWGGGEAGCRALRVYWLAKPAGSSPVLHITFGKDTIFPQEWGWEWG